MFLLMKRDYIGDPKLGRQAHLDRLEFEKSFSQTNNTDKLKEIYRAFSKAEIGREIICLATT